MSCDGGKFVHCARLLRDTSELTWRYFVIAKLTTLYSDRIVSSYWGQVWCRVCGRSHEDARSMHLQAVVWQYERETNDNLRSAPASSDTHNGPTSGICGVWMGELCLMLLGKFF